MTKQTPPTAAPDTPEDVESLILRQAGALADLAFGRQGSLSPNITRAKQNLAFLSPSDLELDLTDPEQRQFGDYELLEKLGEGGMGVVYRARQNSLDREVALKLLSAGPWSSQAFISRFKHEAQSAAALQHPNIVTVFDIGEQDDLNFFTMRLIQGPTLGEFLSQQEGRLAPLAAAKLVRTVANAVDFAHRLGVLHLDIKPSNVLIDERGEPQVADFGLAKQLGLSLDIENDEISGTPNYMAPEQARLEESRLSPATDVYGLGALLYECLTGKPPFVANTLQETLRLVRAEQVAPPRETDQSLPKDIDAICRKCLSRDPSRRYLSARSLANDLTAFIERRPVSVRPIGRLRRAGLWVRREPRLAAVGAIAFTTLLLGLVTTSYQWFRAQQNGATIQALLWESRREAAIDLASNGRGLNAALLLAQNLVEQQDKGLANPVDERRLGLLSNRAPTLLRRVALPPGITSVALSPDGNTLVLGYDDLTLRWFRTDSMQPLGELDLQNQPGFDAGAVIAHMRFASRNILLIQRDNFDWVIRPSGAMARVDLDLGIALLPPDTTNSHSISYSRDGAHALVLGNKDEQRPERTAHSIRLWNVDSWQPVSDAIVGPVYSHIPWMPLSQTPRIASIEPTMQPVILWDLEQQERLVQVGRPEIYSLSAWEASVSGRYLALGDIQGGITLVDVHTASKKRLPAIAGGAINWVTFSEDDAWLAAGAEDGAVLLFDVATQKSIGSELSHDFPVKRVSVHRGRQLLYVSGKNQTTFWRIPEPSNYPRSATRVITSPTVLSDQPSDYGSSWAPDPGLLATAERNGMLSLWQLEPSALLPATSARQFAETLRFDGEHILDVDGSRVRVWSVSAHAPSSPWLHLDHPPGFAEIRSNRVILTSGPQLLVYELPAAGQGFGQPVVDIALRASPQRLLVNQKADRAVLSFGTSIDGYFEEYIEQFNLETGRSVAGVQLPAPLKQMRFSTGQQRLMLLGTNPDRIDILAADTLDHILRVFPDDGFGISSFAELENDLLFSQYAPGTDADQLMRVAGDSDITEPVITQGLTQISGLGVMQQNIVALGSRNDYLFTGSTNVRRVSRHLKSPVVAAFTISPQAGLLARASRNEVQLFTNTGDPLGTPLSVEISGHDAIAQLAFTEDGNSLLARTARGHWVLWDTTADVGAANARLAHLERLLDPLGVVAGTATHISNPLPARAPKSVPGSRRLDDGEHIPPRKSNLPDKLVDLTDHYNMAPTSLRHEVSDTIIDITGMPIGHQRIDGVDFDIRGAILTGNSRRFSEVDNYVFWPMTINVTPQRASGVHVLMYARRYAPTVDQEVYFTITYHYADGSQGIAPVLTQRDVPGWTDNDAPVPIGWLLSTVATYFWDGYQIPISNPLILNPHPERTIVGLTFDDRTAYAMPPTLFALTFEPAAP